MANELNIKNGFISTTDSRVVGGLTATTISGMSYNGSNYTSTGTYGSTNLNASNNQSMIVFSGSNTVGIRQMIV